MVRGGRKHQNRECPSHSRKLRLLLRCSSQRRHQSPKHLRSCLPLDPRLKVVLAVLAAEAAVDRGPSAGPLNEEQEETA